MDGWIDNLVYNSATVGSVYCTLLRAGIISRSALNAKKKFDTV
jgi:hypothetical protein